MAEKIDTSFVINTPEGLLKDNDRGCTERIKRLRRISHSTQPHLDLERAKNLNRCLQRVRRFRICTGFKSSRSERVLLQKNSFT